MYKQKKAFTLVELVVVITILAILATIWFVSYSTYISLSRDTNRMSTISELSKALEIHWWLYTLPLPEDYVSVKVNWETIAYQWQIWKNILETIHFENWWFDPKSKDYFSYYLTKNKKEFQILAFLEEEQETSSIINNTLATDYSTFFPYVSWKKLWILLDTNNTPINKIPDVITATQIDLATTNSGTVYQMYISNDKQYIFSGSILANKIATLANKWKYWPPKSCPDWFISVFGDIEFWQEWFCVAKYEMTYTEEDSSWIPDSKEYDTSNPSDYNTYEYNSNKHISSRVDYPIANINQDEAIIACSNMWKWYHLITNLEWMTIARQIEFENENWSSWISWNWYVYVGNIFDWTQWCIDSTWPRNRWTKTWLSADLSCENKRKLKLFNWEYIWDFLWNVSEHVNKANTTNWYWYNLGNIFLWSATNVWEELRDIWRDIDNRNEYVSLIGEDSESWMWEVYYSSWKDWNIFLRWWSFEDSWTAWLYTLTLDWLSDDSAQYVWFRCAKSF